MRILVVSGIHANLAALDTVILELFSTNSVYRVKFDALQERMVAMKQLLFAMTLGMLVLSMIACAPAAAPVPTRAALSAAAPPMPAGEAVQQGKASDATQNVPNAASAERMIVYTVRLSLEVQDADKTSNDIATIAAQYKGYLAASNMSRDSKNRMRGTITIRIPAESLDAAQKQIEATSLKVLNRNKASNDVTDQYADLGAQLKNLEATEVELTKLLATVRERTGKAEDILAVYNKLIEIRTKIEQIKGQMNVLEKTSALATLTIELVPREEIQVLEPETWMPNKTAAQALRALVQALQGLTNLAIWLVLFLLPILIVLLLPFVVLALILRAILRRRKKVTPTT